MNRENDFVVSYCNEAIPQKSHNPHWVFQTKQNKQENIITN